MNYPWLDAYCLEKPGVEKDYKPEWEAYRYLIRGKMFAMMGRHKDGREIFTVKLPPAFGDALRRQFSDVIPGYYMNKEHWNSLYLDGAVPDDIVRDMADQGHALILESLPKKARTEILGAGQAQQS